MLEDYAIVFGIGRYPTLGQGATPADLESAVPDAKSVEDWLRNKAGVNHIVSVLSPDPQNGGNLSPREPDLRAPFVRLIQHAQQKPGFLLGRRLYVYVSGHGFSPGRQRGGSVLAADASSVDMTNLYISGWLNELQEGGYFHETVLWFDCCMDRFSAVPPSYPSIQPTGGVSAPGAAFAAFAAPRPLKTAEVSRPDRPKPCGVFTWALLDGLNGAAIDRYGRVTGESLEAWLRQAVYRRLPPSAIADVRIAKEPDCPTADQRIIFARGLPPKLFDVKFQCPAVAAGTEITLWGGVPLRPITVTQSTVPENGIVATSLAAGLYHVDVQGAGKSFEVVRDTEVVLDPAVAKLQPASGDTLFKLGKTSQSPMMRVTIFAANFELVDHVTGDLSIELPFGVYKIRSQLPRALSDDILLLDREIAKPGPLLEIASVVPVMGTLASHEYQANARLDQVASADPNSDETGNAQVSLMTRIFQAAWSSESGGQPMSQTWDKVAIVNSRGKEVLAPKFEDRVSNGNDPYSLATAELRAGDYYVRLELSDGNSVEIALPIYPEWCYEVHILRLVNGDGTLDPRPRLSVLMRRQGAAQFSDETTKTFELARFALADERGVMSDELEGILWGKYENPIAGIIGGHLLILAFDEGKLPSLEALDDVVTNLRALLGNDHPDVEALSLRCPNVALRRQTPIRSAPTFKRSWDLIVDASLAMPKLVPQKLARRTIANLELPPFFAVCPDQGVQAKVIGKLAQSLTLESTAETGDISLMSASSPKVIPESGNVLQDAFAEARAIASDPSRPALRSSMAVIGASMGVAASLTNMFKSKLRR